MNDVSQLSYMKVKIFNINFLFDNWNFKALFRLNFLNLC
jgi:hypothetical protein